MVGQHQRNEYIPSQNLEGDAGRGSTCNCYRQRGAPSPTEAASAATGPAPVDHRMREIDPVMFAFAETLKRHSSISNALNGVDGASLRTSRTAAASLEERLTAAKYELAHYESELPLPPTSSSQDVLDWWLKRRHGCPSLYKVSCVFLAVPATSASSERVFFVGRLDQDQNPEPALVGLDEKSGVLARLRGCGVAHGQHSGHTPEEDVTD